MTSGPRDRFGLLIRPAFSGEILANMNRVDLLHLISDDWLEAPARWILAMRELGTKIPLHLHGKELELAASLDARSLDGVARLVDALRPERWSEHLAGEGPCAQQTRQLVAPPRTIASIESSLRNIDRARRVVGSVPHTEILTPQVTTTKSELSTAEWITSVAWASGVSLVLDLDDLCDGAKRSGIRPTHALQKLPLDRVSTVHVGGGHDTGASSESACAPDRDGELLSHEIRQLLHELGKSTTQGLDVILERETGTSGIEHNLDTLDEIRSMLASGRRSRVEKAAVLAVR